MGNCAYRYTFTLELESIHIFSEQALWVNARAWVDPTSCDADFDRCYLYFAARASFHAIAGWVNFGEVSLLILC